MTEIERLRDALDHIIRQCAGAKQSSRRLSWIKTRAELALAGKDDWESVLKVRPAILDNFPGPEARARKDKITQILLQHGFTERPLPGGGRGISRSVYYAVEEILAAHERGELK